MSREKASDEQFGFTTTCAGGLEQLTAGEVTALTGRPARCVPGAVTWHGTPVDGYRVCLHSRFGSRVLLTIAEFDASDGDAVYQGAAAIDWRLHFRKGTATSFAVDCTLTSSTLNHSRYAAQRVKDAVVDQFRLSCGARPRVEVRQPDLRLHLHIHKNRAALSIDFSGESLHRRGYRVAPGEAPLKEAPAAAVVHLALDRLGYEPDFLLDPMCGSATLLIEAALILDGSAPGLGRRSFGFTGWRGHDEQRWQQVVTEAVAGENPQTPQRRVRLIGFDADAGAVAGARANIRRAGLEGRIHVEKRQLARLENPGGRGVVLVNPPYGRRLADSQEVKYIYRCLGRKIRSCFAGQRFAVITAAPDFAGEFGVTWSLSHRLYNGALRCRLFVADVERSAKRQAMGPLTITSGGGGGETRDFANRLVKKGRQLLPWAARRGISCFRLYDADIPNYNFAVDIYGCWVHVQEYAAPPSIDPAVAAKRFRDGLATIRAVLGVPRSRIFIKTRRRQRGTKQYRRLGSGRRLHEVREGDCRFLLNFTDYLDTGLFLDHRITREMIGAAAKGGRFLNLFGYTGTATVHAAYGGAETTTTVDLSARYLARARANMALNGFGGPQHRFIRADCRRWLQDQKPGGYDLIFLDPPTFSNTGKKRRVFDIQRHHRDLVTAAMRLLADGDGLLIFSTNFRRFKLDQRLLRRFSVRDISRRTLDRDFRHNPRIHHCFEIRPPAPRPTILFLCTGNSCRSQMAEAWARHLLGDLLIPYSAGIKAHGLDSRAVGVMAEAGVDMQDQRSTRIEDLTVSSFDYVITVCGHADRSCPRFPAATRIIHRGFDDPPKLAASVEDKDEQLEIYRRVRDEIREYIISLPQVLRLGKERYDTDR